MNLKEYLEISLSNNEILINESIKELYSVALLDNFKLTNSDRLRALPFFSYLFEGGGLVKSCLEIAHIIAYQVDKTFAKNPHSYSFVLPRTIFVKHNIDVHFENIYVDIVCSNVSYKVNKGYAEYDQKISKSLWNKTEKDFASIMLTVHIPYDNYEHTKSCVDLVAHELRHYWQDYDFLSRHNIGLDDYRKDVEAKFTKDEKNLVLNYLNKTEFEAYLTQLDAEIGKLKFVNLKKACVWLDKYSSVWQLYKDLKDDVYTNGSLKIQKQFSKVWKKFINHVSHILNDHLANVEYINESSYNKAEFINYINKKFDL